MMDFQEADKLNEAIRAVGVRHRALAIQALAPFGIHPGHKLVLFEIAASGPCTQVHLVTVTGYEPPTITLSVRQLETAGLVIRRPAPSDRRAVLVELSDKGRALLPALEDAWCELAEKTISGLAGTSKGQLLEVLTDLALSLDSLNDPSKEPAPALPQRIARRKPSANTKE